MICKDCKHHRYAEIKTSLPYFHKTSWMCVKKEILFGTNKAATQVIYPKFCNKKELI